MADSVTVTGTAEKDSDSRGAWQYALDIAEELEVDTGAPTLDIAAGGGTVTVPVSLVTPGDLIILKTPQPITITAAFSGGGSMTNTPCRGLFLLQTEGLTSLVLTNNETADVKVGVTVSRRVT